MRIGYKIKHQNHFSDQKYLVVDNVEDKNEINHYWYFFMPEKLTHGVGRWQPKGTKEQLSKYYKLSNLK